MSTRAEVGVTINSIPRHFLLDNEMFETARADLGEWMRVADVEAVFTPGVAYMPVPRCDQCKWWRQSPDAPRPTASDEGACDRIPLDLGQRVGMPDKARVRFQNVNGVGLMTDSDFGCVQWMSR